ncbi:hypothetical protein, partial [Micromonospora sp. NPDC049679]|uniref:hypothetical protein n=1 Tax=Micromonospora sp. NPDC049679 TaxID=3155920 RepID=UPI0033EC2424
YAVPDRHKLGKILVNAVAHMVTSASVGLVKKFPRRPAGVVAPPLAVGAPMTGRARPKARLA